MKKIIPFFLLFILPFYVSGAVVHVTLPANTISTVNPATFFGVPVYIPNPFGGDDMRFEIGVGTFHYDDGFNQDVAMTIPGGDDMDYLSCNTSIAPSGHWWIDAYDFNTAALPPTALKIVGFRFADATATNYYYGWMELSVDDA